MNTLLIALKNIRRNKLMTIVMVLLLSIAIVLLNSTFSSIRGMFSELVFAKGLNDENLYAVQAKWDYYDSFYHTLNTEESNKYIHQVVDGYCKEMGIDVKRDSQDYYSIFNDYDCAVRYVVQNKDKNGIKSQYPIYENFINVLNNSGLKYKAINTWELRYDTVYYKEYMGLNINIFSDEMAEKINMNIAYGKDLKETKSDGEIIEAVVVGDGNFSKDIKIGDEFDISFFNFKTNKYETKTIKIVGIMGSPYYDFAFYSSYINENKTVLENLISRNVIDYKSEAGNSFFTIYIKPFDGFNGNEKNYNAYYGKSFTQFYFTLENPTDNELNNLKHELAVAGYEFTSVKTAYDNTFNEVKNTVLEDAVILFISVFISIITVCGTIILYISDNIRTHYIFMLCGAKLKDHIMVCLINVLINCIISVGLSALYLHIQNIKKIQNLGEIGDLFGITYDRYNVYLTLLLIIIILIVTWAVSSKMFRFKMYKGRENTK